MVRRHVSVQMMQNLSMLFTQMVEYLVFHGHLDMLISFQMVVCHYSLAVQNRKFRKIDGLALSVCCVKIEIENRINLEWCEKSKLN